MRIRKKVNGTAEHPRVCIHKSLKHIYLTVVDDGSREEGSLAILNLTTNTKTWKDSGKKSFRNIASAKKLGEMTAKALLEKGIKKVVFDRAGYQYHGCVKAVAEAIRESGITI